MHERSFLMPGVVVLTSRGFLVRAEGGRSLRFNRVLSVSRESVQRDLPRAEV